MLKIKFWALALASAFVIPFVARAQFATALTSYNPGTGFAAGFTNGSAAVGAPALGAAVTPFAPPSSKTQIVSIGAGGEITLQFATPIENDPMDPYGINFLLFANSFFVSSGGNVSGLFSHAISSIIQVSQDGSTWYTLNPALAPEPGQLFPTDGTGNPQVAVNPALTLNNFTGQNLAGIRSLYAGSAGGTGYDLAWAEDANGNSVTLSNADFVRIEVQSGVIDLDAISETVPVPEARTPVWLLAFVCGGLVWHSWRARQTKVAALASAKSLVLLTMALSFLGCFTTVNANADTIVENFTNNPAADGWQVFGDTNLFSWDSTNHDLAVTWDSSQPNSYFYYPLSTVIGEQDGFTLDFDLNITNAVAGGDGFELAIGFIHLDDATSTNFFRGSGYQSPNLVEFDYFPPTTNSASIDTTVVDAEDDFEFFYDDTLGLTNGITYHVSMDHSVGSALITTDVYTYDTNGMLELYTSLPYSYLEIPFYDFFVDAISISSYSDENGYGATIFAQGTVANIVVTTAPRPIGNLTEVFNGTFWQTQFSSRTNWSYTLERSTNLVTWCPVTRAVTGTGTTLVLQDTNAPPNQAFYQVIASQ